MVGGVGEERLWFIGLLVVDDSRFGFGFANEEEATRDTLYGSCQGLES